MTTHITCHSLAHTVREKKAQTVSIQGGYLYNSWVHCFTSQRSGSILNSQCVGINKGGGAKFAKCPFFRVREFNFCMHAAP